MSLNDMALYMLKVVTLAQHITFLDICKMLRNEEHIYCKYLRISVLILLT